MERREFITTLGAAAAVISASSAFAEEGGKAVHYHPPKYKALSETAAKTLIPLSQARLYVVPERIRRVEFGHRAALKTRYPVAFRLPSFGGAPYA